MALPQYFVLKSNHNNRYLHYIKEDGEVHGLNKFSAENPVSPYAKYEIEMVQTEERLVHIKCCYNNKYLVRQSEIHMLIAATADEPVEDRSQWSCTLFQILPMEGESIRFRHVQLDHYACLWRFPSMNVYDSCLVAGSQNPGEDMCYVFTVTDWKSLCILPRYLAFKGDNGCYLSLREVNSKPHLQFESTDIDPAAVNEIVTGHDGNILIMSQKKNKFWRLITTTHDPWIMADLDYPTCLNTQMFLPVRVDINAIALKNLRNNLFCNRLTANRITNCLSANGNTPDRARLEVTELATSRHIYSVNYDLNDARIYRRSLLVLASGTVVNRTNEPNTFDVKLAYIDSMSKSWNASVTPKTGVETDILASVPVIIVDEEGEKVKILDGSTGVFKWGEAIEWSKISEAVYEVTVPPMTQVKVTLQATKGSCDVPFSYNQVDTLTTGKIVGHTMDDGIYTGVNYYNINYNEELAEI